MLSAWVAVRDSSSAGQYMLRYSIEAHSYHVQLSDLEHIWEERLDRRKLIQRALNDETSIDPSEDTSQLRVLLDTIEHALRSDEGTSATLSRAKDTTDWQLDLSSPLPEPLDPLTWHVYLQPAPPSAVREELTLPLLRDTYRRTRQILDLSEKLKAKDHVISKLIDGLEAAGTDLGSVFLQAVGQLAGKKATREAIALRVPGLQPFQLEQWQGEATEQEEEGWTQMMSAISSDHPSSLHVKNAAPAPPKPRIPQPQSPTSSSTASREPTPVPVQAKEAETLTPARPRKRLGRIGGASKPVPQPVHDSADAHVTPKKKLGHIGGGNALPARTQSDGAAEKGVDAVVEDAQRSSPPGEVLEQEDKEEEEEEEESTQQRADRRREELRRELEAKRAALGSTGGVKKKRKF